MYVIHVYDIPDIGWSFSLRLHRYTVRDNVFSVTLIADSSLCTT